MQGQRRRHVEHFVQAHRAGILHCEFEIRGSPRGRFAVHGQSDRRGEQLSTRKDREEARGGAADRGRQQLQADVQDAGYVVIEYFERKNLGFGD